MWFIFELRGCLNCVVVIKYKLFGLNVFEIERIQIQLVFGSSFSNVFEKKTGNFKTLVKNHRSVVQPTCGHLRCKVRRAL